MKDLKFIAKQLKEYPNEAVSDYLMYVKQLETEKDKSGKLKAWWITSKTTEDQLVGMFKSVAKDKIYIDGKHITLQYKGKLMVSYDYQAYKNKMLMVYPETKMDLQIVKKDDVFNFRKKDGRILYNHDITSPFVEISPDNIAGAYFIIENSRGSFLELLGPEAIKKMRSVAKTDTIWFTWYDQMVLKSVVKRGCKRHFDDVVSNMEALDNENYDLSQLDEAKAPDAILDHIKTFEDKEELLSWAAGNENKLYHNDEGFREAVKAQKIILEQDMDPVNNS